MVTRSSISGDVFDSPLDPDSQRKQNLSGRSPGSSTTQVNVSDSNGNIIGVNGVLVPSPADILQNFWESVLTNPLDSSTVGVS